MGNLLDKLNKLKATKEAIKNKLIEKGVSVSDTDTFASYADKIDNVGSKFMIYPYIGKYGEDTATDNFGTFRKSAYMSYARIIKYSGNKNDFPANRLINIMGGGYYSPIQYIAIENASTTTIELDNLVLKNVVCLILPREFLLKNICIADEFSNMLKRGIQLPRVSESCSSLFIGRSHTSQTTGGLNGKGVVVKLYNDHLCDVYLNKLYLDKDALLVCFNKLHNYSGDTKAHRFIIGSVNIAQLTEDELKIAEEKGWQLT